MIQHNRTCSRRLGFNTIELVVVVLIVFILMGVVLVVLKIQRENERRYSGEGQTHNQLKHLTLACHNANDVWKRLPPAFDQYGQMKFPASVHVHLLPYIEHDGLYKMFLEREGKVDWDEFSVLAFVCHMDFTLTNQFGCHGFQNFAANLRVFSDKGMETRFDANMLALAGIQPSQASIPGSFPDGTSNTIFFTLKYSNCQDGGSRYVAAPDSKFAAFFGQNAATVTTHPSDPRATFQDQPTAGECLINPLMAQSMSKHGLSVGMGDGSVRIVNTSISPRTWNLAVQPNDGMELGNDW